MNGYMEVMLLCRDIVICNKLLPAHNLVLVFYILTIKMFSGVNSSYKSTDLCICNIQDQSMAHRTVYDF